MWSGDLKPRLQSRRISEQIAEMAPAVIDIGVGRRQTVELARIGLVASEVLGSDTVKRWKMPLTLG